MAQRGICIRNLELARNMLAIQRRNVTSSTQDIQTGLTRFVSFQIVKCMLYFSFSFSLFSLFILSLFLSFVLSLRINMLSFRKEMYEMVREQQSFKKGEICDSVSVYVRGGAGGTK